MWYVRASRSHLVSITTLKCPDSICSQHQTSVVTRFFSEISFAEGNVFIKMLGGGVEKRFKDAEAMLALMSYMSTSLALVATRRICSSLKLRLRAGGGY